MAAAAVDSVLGMSPAASAFVGPTGRIASSVSQVAVAPQHPITVVRPSGSVVFPAVVSSTGVAMAALAVVSAQSSRHALSSRRRLLHGESRVRSMAQRSEIELATDEAAEEEEIEEPPQPKLKPRKDRTESEMAKIEKIETALARRPEEKIVRKEDDYDGYEDDQVIPGVGLFINREPQILVNRAPTWTLDDLPTIPFLGHPKYRDYCPNFPGDLGFDPLNMAWDEGQFRWNWEAEIKHGRLAMLAVIGWPASEYMQRPIAEYFRQPDMLADGGRAPSLLNGGLGEPINMLTVGLIFSAFTIGDWIKPPGDAGDYRFDPLELRDLEPPVISWILPPGQMPMDAAEMWNGRLAMIAITVFVYEEYTFSKPMIDIDPWTIGDKAPVIPEWPFYPFWEDLPQLPQF